MSSTYEAETRSARALAPYPVYKDSGVPWLGKVPSHWKRLPGRACYRKKRVPNKGLTETTVLSLSYGHIVVKPPEKLHGLVPASFATYQIVEPGDIIVRPTDLQNDWTSLRVGLSRNRGVITSAYMCLHTEKMVLRTYGHLLLHTYDLKKVFYGMGSGLRQNLDWRDFKYLPCIVPPIPEQAAIVSFVDHADRRIRRYIRAKERMIELLKEQKQAIIHQAVTGQIDVRTGHPYAAYKDSGVVWLGKVPAHWDIRRLKNVGKAIIGLTYDPRDVVEEDYGVLVLRASNISEGHIVDADNVFVRGPVPRHLITRVGDILLCSRSGSRALIGKNARIGATSAGITFGAFMTVFRGFNNDYLHNVFNSKVFEQQSGAFFTSTINQLTLGILYSIKVPWPPVEERGEIVGHIARGTAHVAIGIAKARRQIDLAQEYRTRLIADVVTGKLDVSEATASLSEVAPLAMEDTQDYSIGRISEADPKELDPAFT